MSRGGGVPPADNRNLLDDYIEPCTFAGDEDSSVGNPFWLTALSDSGSLPPSRATNNELKGAFYGDRHQEVAEAFLRVSNFRQLSGSFGAKRQ